MNKTLIVARREFTKVVKKPSFWISTLTFPVLIGIIGFISGFSSMQIEESIKRNQEEMRNVIIQDDSGLINVDLISQMGYSTTDQRVESIERVKNGEISAYIYYPAELLDTKNIEIYAKDLGIFGNEAFSNIANQLIKNSALAGIENPLLLQAYNTQFESSTQSYNEGELVEYGLEKFIVPIIAVAIYFVLTTFATSYLLMSVSEEKENRAIEIVLSAITPRQLIQGKIVGLIGVVLTQVILLGVFSIAVILFFQNSIQLPIDFSQVQVSVGQILSALFYAFLSFFIIACTMVGVGAAMPNYKEASSFSSIFIMASILPIYFVTAIIADPSGQLSVILSYTPFANGLILLFRSTFGAMSSVEVITTGIVLIIYALIALFLAFKLFEYGSLEYGKKISFKEFARSLKKKKD